MSLNEEPEAEERIAKLLAEYEELPYDEREAFLEGLSADDRDALLAAELEAEEEAAPEAEE